MNGRHYRPETKAAVLAALLEGQSVHDIAAEYKVPVGTVKSWKSRELKETVATIATETKADIGELLVQYMRESLKTLVAQLEVFRDAKWLRQQSAADVAVLHGVQTDKMMRLLEALNRAESPD